MRKVILIGFATVAVIVGVLMSIRRMCAQDLPADDAYRELENLASVSHLPDTAIADLQAYIQRERSRTES